MGFFTEPAFFLLLVPIVAIAVVLGLLQRPLARYGMVASVLMLALLFSRTLDGLVFFICFLVLSFGLSRYVLKLFAGEEPEAHAVAKYRVALALQIAPLAVYKVGVFLVPDFLGFIGISYITFKGVQVLIETRDGLIKECKPFDYLYFLIFFPTFTSGPIMRSRQFEKDVHANRTRDEYLTLLYRGAGWFLLGVLYKFIGSPLATWLMWMGPSVIGTDTPGAFAATQVVYGFAYGLNMFFDFAGYSHMAVGLGFALGIEVPPNFRAPFMAVDIKDFWDRWHISLSHWLRDFVFMRFTRASLEHGWIKSTVTTACVAFMINFLLMGLWHGISVDNLVYGIYHGVLLSTCEVFQRKSSFYKKHRKDRWFRVCSWAITMLAVFYGFALFGGQALHPIVMG